MVVIAIMMATTAMAQQKEQKEMLTVEQIAKMKAERMRKQLLLGNDQYEKVYKNCLKEAEKQRKRMQQIAKEREEMAKELKGILNEAQWERYEQMQKPRVHRKAMKKGWRHNQNGKMHCPMMPRHHKFPQDHGRKFNGRNNHFEPVPGGVLPPYNLKAGNITYSQLQMLLPFDNTLVLCSIKGSDLLSKFINTSNSNYFTSYTAYGESLKGKINSNETYYILVDSYTSTYAPNKLTEVARYTEGVYARDLLAEYIRAGGWNQ